MFLDVHLVLVDPILNRLAGQTETTICQTGTVSSPVRLFRLSVGSRVPSPWPLFDHSPPSIPCVSLFRVVSASHRWAAAESHGAPGWRPDLLPALLERPALVPSR